MNKYIASSSQPKNKGKKHLTRLYFLHFEYILLPPHEHLAVLKKKC